MPKRVYVKPGQRWEVRRSLPLDLGSKYEMGYLLLGEHEHGTPLEIEMGKFYPAGGYYLEARGVCP